MKKDRYHRPENPEGLTTRTAVSVKVLLLLLAIPLTTVAETAGTPSDTSETTLSSDSMAVCVPEVRIVAGTARWHFCLASMTPAEDSCAEVRIHGYGMTLLFNYRGDSGWWYTGIENSDTSEVDPSVSVSLTSDEQGFLTGVLVRCAPDDSLSFPPPLGPNSDLPVTDCDTAPQVTLSAMRIVHTCGAPKPRLVWMDRVWTYPPGYRHRYIPPNYPELSMFHCGMSVRMPAGKSIEKRALMFCTYHFSTLEELVFDNPEEIMKKEARINRLGLNRPKPDNRAKKKRRPSLFSLRPLY